MKARDIFTNLKKDATPAPEAKMLYFYNVSMPENGCYGTATLENGVLTADEGTAANMVQAIRDRAANDGMDNFTDSEIYDYLNGWSNGLMFATDEPTTWTVD
jgi:hypothetical protein